MADSYIQTSTKRILLRLMHFLYNIGIFFLGLSIRIASLFNPKAKDWVQGRKNLFNNLPNVTGENVVWFHCASLGEFDQGIPLMKKLINQDPSIFLLVTFFSPSGMKFYHKREKIANLVTYLPLDTSRNAKRFVKYFKPKKVFFVKYEFWGNHILEAKRNGAEVYNVSGIFRENHRFFKWYGGFFRHILSQFEWFFVQNKQSEELLNSIGISDVSISGDSRFDRVLENKKSVTENTIISQFQNGEKLIVIGSSWPEDEEILIPWIKNQKNKILIAPHNIDDNHIQQILSELPEAKRYSESENQDISNSSILILDTIGQLSNAYSYGFIAYVGGGFSGSLHNILEPAVFGLPVIFGPKHKRFPEGQAFIDIGFGFSISSTDEFEKAYDAIISDYNAISQKEISFVEKNAGASNRILTQINSISK